MVIPQNQAGETVLFFHDHQGTADCVSSQKQPVLILVLSLFSVLQSQEGSTDIPTWQTQSYYSKCFRWRTCRRISEGEKKQNKMGLPFKSTYIKNIPLNAQEWHDQNQTNNRKKQQWSVFSPQNWTQGTSDKDFQAAEPAAEPHISLNKWGDPPKHPWII